MPLESVVEFKREVYCQALSELSRFIPAVASSRPEPALPAGCPEPPAEVKIDPEMKTA